MGISPSVPTLNQKRDKRLDEEQRAAQRNAVDKAWLDERQAGQMVMEAVVAAFFPHIFFRIFGGSRDERYGVVKLLLVRSLTSARDEQKQDTEPVQEQWRRPLRRRRPTTACWSAGLQSPQT